MPPKSARAKALAGGLAILTWFQTVPGNAISLDDIQLWTGSGSNRAALVIEWSVPESLTNSSVPVPIADKTLAWGYCFNGTATGSQMLQAVLATDPKLYVVASETNGTLVEGIGYNLNGNGIIGVTDGSRTNLISNGLLTNTTANLDSAQALNHGDLYWGGVLGPKWELWNETNGMGGFLCSPNRGTNACWTATDTNDFLAGYHGQWVLAQSSLDGLQLTNGSWLGFSVAAAESEPAATAPCNLNKHAPVSPDGTYVAYIACTNDFAVQIVSASNLYQSPPYDNPQAVLGPPTLQFIDHFTPHQTSVIHRSKIVEPPYWTDPNSNDVIAEINVGGQITVNLGRRICHDPNHPYGMDFIVYGNSYYAVSGYSGSEITDYTDESVATLPGGSAGVYGHTTLVSVSQDGTNWYTYPCVQALVPDNAYRWDDNNHIWTEEQMNGNKPVNPALTLPAGITVAGALNEQAGACGGTGYSLQASGLPWIQYICITAGTSLDDTSAGDYAVIDAIGAVNPVTVGDALVITPADLAAGITNLVFQKADDSSQTLISLNFDAVSADARISAVSLSEFSAFAPVVGTVSSAYQLQARPINSPDAVAVQADLGLRVGGSYSGNGSDLRVYQWNSTNWIGQPFAFDPASAQVLVSGVTNFTAFVVVQIVPPVLSAHTVTNGFAFQFKPVANCPHVLQRSANLVDWTPIYTNTPSGAQPITWRDPNAPTGKAFYRIQLIVP